MAAPQDKPTYRPDIDGLRAVAVLAVIIFHAFPQTLPGGFIGVDIFFVISGFLITGILQKHLNENNFSFRAFYAARIRRIFPSLIIVLTTVLVAGWLLLPVQLLHNLGKHITSGTAFISNLILWNEAGYFDQASETKPLLHLWSLGIEEQFYLAWPLLLWIAHKKKIPLIGPTAIIALLSFLTNIIITNSNPIAGFYSPLTRFWELMAGAMLVTLPPCRRKNTAHALSIAGITLLAVAMFAFNTYTRFPSWSATLPVIGTVLLIAAGPGTIINSILSCRPAVAIGLISYPFYLWHWPLLVFLHLHTGSKPSPPMLILALVIAVLLATLTYYLIEKPIRYGQRHNAVSATLCLLIIAIGGPGLAFLAKKTPAEKPIPQTTGTNEKPQSIQEKYPLAACLFDAVPKSLRRYCSIYGNQDAPKTLILWGDSHSGEWLKPWGWSALFYEVAREHADTRVIRFSTPGCPPLLGVRRTGSRGSSEYCHDITQGEAILTAIRALRPDLIVMIARWSLYATGERYKNGGLKPDYLPITTAPTNTPMPDGRDAMTEKLLPTVIAVSEIADTLILKNFPVLLNLPTLTPGAEKSIEPTLQQHKSLSDPSNHLLEQAVELPHVRLYDPTPVLCSEKCVSSINGTLMYRDDSHPSPEGALLFKPYIEKLLTTSP